MAGTPGLAPAPLSALGQISVSGRQPVHELADIPARMLPSAGAGAAEVWELGILSRSAWRAADVMSKKQQAECSTLSEEEKKYGSEDQVTNARHLLMSTRGLFCV